MPVPMRKGSVKTSRNSDAANNVAIVVSFLLLFMFAVFGGVVAYKVGWTTGYVTARDNSGDNITITDPNNVTSHMVVKTSYVEICSVNTSVFSSYNEIDTNDASWYGSFKRLAHVPVAGSHWLVKSKIRVYSDGYSDPGTVLKFISQENPKHMRLERCMQPPLPSPAG